MKISLSSVIALLIILLCICVYEIENKCTPKVNLVACSKKGTNIRLSYYTNHQSVKIELGCGSSSKIKSIDWKFTDLETNKDIPLAKFKNKMFISFGSNTVLDGKHKLAVSVTEKNGDTVTDTCAYLFIVEPAVIIFNHAAGLYVTGGESYTIDITTSKNYGRIPLNPEWEVQCEKKKTPICAAVNPCDIKVTGTKFTIVSKVCQETISFIVQAKSQGKYVIGKAVVFVTPSGFTKVKIECRKNCDQRGSFLSDPKEEILLELVCLSLCVGFKSQPPDWVIIGRNGQELAKNKYKVDKFQLVIFANSLQYDEGITIEVSRILTYRAGSYVRTIDEVGKPTCDIKPKKGKSLLTAFVINCFATSEHLNSNPPFYQVYQEVSAGNEILILESPAPRMETILSRLNGQSKQTLSVKGYDIFFNEFLEKLPIVELEDVAFTEEQLKKVQDNLMQLHCDYGDSLVASQLAQGIIAELKKLNTDENTKNEMILKTVKCLRQMAINNIYVHNQISSVVSLIIEEATNSDEIKLEMSEVCKTLIKTKVDELVKSRYYKKATIQVQRFSALIRNCADFVLEKPLDKITTTTATTPMASMMDNVTSIISTTTVKSTISTTKGIKVKKETTTPRGLRPSVITTPEFTVAEPVVKEDYPDYTEEQILPDPQKIQIKNNAIDTVTESQKLIAEVQKNGEKFTAENEKFVTTVVSDTAKEFPKKNIIAKNVEVKFAVKISQDNRNVTAVVTSYEPDFLPITRETIPEINSPIVDINLFERDKKDKPTKNINDINVDISLKVINDAIVSRPYTMTVSSNKNEWVEPKIDYEMNVHRINLPKNTVCQISFKNMTANSKFQVVFKHYKRPSIEDFKKQIFAIVASDTGTFNMECPVNMVEHEDRFLYMAVLPHNDVLKGSNPISLNYILEVSSHSCLLFNQKEFQWKIGNCTHTTYLDNDSELKLLCTCSHLTLFAGTYSNITNKLDKLNLLEFTVERFVNYIVFAHTAIVFVCYCIALCFLLRRKKVALGRDKLFLLTDITKNDLFAYLLLIKTGTLNDSGTTSNIVIELFGTNYGSKVIDIFEHFAPYLVSRALIFSTYCETITILDLQDKTVSYFFIEKWLSLDSRNENLEILAQPNSQVYVTEDLMLNVRKFARFYAGAENTWNIFSNAQDMIFPYEQRITVILSMIYTTYVINLMIIHNPESLVRDKFGHGSNPVYREIIPAAILSGFLSSIINFPFVYFFRNSVKRKNKNLLLWTEFSYSSKVGNICWSLLIIWICLCFTYICVFGFWIPFISSLIWVLSTIVAIIFSVFIYENIYLIIYNILVQYFAKIPRRLYNFYIILKEIETQRKFLFKKFGELLFRPYFFKHYEPLPSEDIYNLKSYVTRRFIVSEEWKDLCIFCCYLFLLYLICISNADELMYISNSHMDDILLNKYYELNNIREISDVYDYIEETIIPIVHPTSWYDGYNLVDGGLLEDFSTKILGVVQLRQQRRKQPCTLPKKLKNLPVVCHNNASVFDGQPYSNGSLTTISQGILELYSGEGYVMPMGRTLVNSYTVFDTLKKHNWIDINTKVLFIEFWTYNANQNIFNSIRVIIERDISGHYVKSHQITTLRLMFANEVLELFISTILVLWILLIITMLIRRVVVIIRHKSGFLQGFWNILDILMLLLTITVLIIYFVKNDKIEKLILQVSEAENNDFIHYFSIMSLATANLYISGLLLALATLRLWKYLRFHIQFQITERTLSGAKYQLFWLGLCHTIIIFMSSIFLYIVFGRNFGYLSTITNTLTSLWFFSLNLMTPFNYGFMYIYHPGIYILISCFMLSSMLIVNFYVSILCEFYEEAIEYYSARESLYNLKNYMTEEYIFRRGLIKANKVQLRLKSGGCEVFNKGPVYPKADAQRYADVFKITTEKLEQMKLIAIGVIVRNIKAKQKARRLNYEEYLLLIRITLELLKNPDKGQQMMFFYTSDPADTEKIVFVSNNRITKMEMIVRKMFEKGEIKKTGVPETVLHIDGGAKQLDRYYRAVNAIAKALENIKIITGLIL